MTTTSLEVADQIKEIVDYLEKCQGAPNPPHENEVDFYAQLASDTGKSVPELQALRNNKLSYLTDRLQFVPAKIKSSSREDAEHEIIEVFQLLASFYDNYAYLLHPIYRSSMKQKIGVARKILEKASLNIEGDATVFDVPVSNDGGYNVEELLSRLK